MTDRTIETVRREAQRMADVADMAQAVYLQNGRPCYLSALLWEDHEMATEPDIAFVEWIDPRSR